MPQCGNRIVARTLSHRRRQGVALKRGERPWGECFRGAFSLVAMDVQGIARVFAQGGGASPRLVQDNADIVETSIPARLDNLSWSGFHTRVVLALGITWILDGLEVTLAGTLSGA